MIKNRLKQITTRIGQRSASVKRLLLILVVVGVSVTGVTLVSGSHAASATASFSPTVIPFSAPEITNPQRGAYNWQYADYGGDAGRGAPIPMKDLYERDDFHWNQIETAAPTAAQIANKTGTYDLSMFEQGAAAAKALGGKFGFRISLMGMGDQRVPDYIINNQGTYGGNGQGGSQYAPDYNNDAFLSRIEALMKAIGAKYGNDPRFGMGDIGFYGMYGEWHLFGAPSGSTAINTASAIRIINAHVDNMPQMHWVMMYGNSDVSDAVHYAMTKVSSQGNYVGWRNDCLGSASQGYAQTGSAAWNQTPSSQADQWKRALVVGELCGLDVSGSSDIGPGTFGDVLSQVGVFHYSMVGNGNTHNGEPYSQFPADQQANWIQSMKTAGYRYELRNVNLPAVLTTGKNFTMGSTWANSGVAPTYDKWNVDYGLKDSSGNSVWEGVSSTNLKTILPTNGGTVDSSTTMQVPPGVPAGSYTLYAKIADPTAYYSPMQLASSGRQADGSYTLGSVSVQTGTVTPDPIVTPSPIPTPIPNLVSGKTFTASDGAGVAGGAVANVNDGNTSTRWISTPADNVTLSTDLGATYTLNKVGINWAGDTTKDYDIQVSTNNTAWTTVASGVTNNTTPQQIDTTSFSPAATGRYLRIVAKDRWNTAYGNSIYEIVVNGNPSMAPSPPLISIVGDINKDGHVTSADLAILLSHWNQTVATGTNGDINNDNKVSSADLAQLLSNWGK